MWNIDLKLWILIPSSVQLAREWNLDAESLVEARCWVLRAQLPSNSLTRIIANASVEVEALNPPAY